MTQRTGVFSLLQVSKRMCKLILAFAPIIRRVYPENTALQLALEAAMASCEVLEQELSEVYNINP